MTPIQAFFAGAGAVILLEAVLLVGVILGHKIGKNVI